MHHANTTIVEYLDLILVYVLPPYCIIGIYRIFKEVQQLSNHLVFFFIKVQYSTQLVQLYFHQRIEIFKQVFTNI